MDKLSDTARQRLYGWGIWPLWLLLTTSLVFRSIIPIDETRYLSVAWEMWLRNDFLVPYLNGQPYSHKPPLLFWLIQGGWVVFGLNEWWPRLVGPGCALINLWLSRKLAYRLWPDAPEVGLLTPWILIATLLWTLFATAAMFDMLLADCVLLAMLGLLVFNQGQSGKGSLYLAVAIGLGLLAKGPVVLLHILPVALWLNFWRADSKMAPNWLALPCALLAGIGLALAWAVPAATFGGADYGQAIFWHQTVDRTIGTEIHARPFYWYVLFLPLILFPWLVWSRLWQSSLTVPWRADPGLRFCLVWLLGGFSVFSILPSKQIHYLIPLLPAFALWVARIISRPHVHADTGVDKIIPLAVAGIGLVLILLPYLPGLSKLHWTQTIQPGWGLAVFSIAVLQVLIVRLSGKLSLLYLAVSIVVAIVISFRCFFQYNGAAYDLRPAAEHLKRLNEQHIPCVFIGNYQGQLHFLGRLSQPLATINASEIIEWARRHPEGYLISLEKNQPTAVDYLQPHRESWLVFRMAGRLTGPQLWANQKLW